MPVTYSARTSNARGCGSWLRTFAITSLLLSAVSARAQDDWGITREPTRPHRPPVGATRDRPRPTTEQNPGAARSAMIERYVGVLSSDPDQPFALQRLLTLYRERDGNLDRLPGELTQRIEQGRHVYALLVVLGDVERARNHNDLARAAYQRAVALEGTRPAALRALAVLEADSGNADAARDLFERAVTASPNGESKRQLLRKLAELALAANDFDLAARQFARLSDGGSVYLAADYARALAAKGEHTRAVAEYQRVLARLRGDPRVLAPILIELAKEQIAISEIDAAIATLGNARRLAGASGLNAEIDEALLEAYRQAGRLTDLARDLERRARSADDLALLGRVWDETGDSAKALAAYRRALANHRQAIDLRVRVIALLSREGRLSEVVDEYRALMRAAPNEPRFVIELAQLLMETGKRDEAMKLLAQTSAQHPRDARLHEALAQLYGRWNEPERAASELTLLTKIAPEDAMHWIVLGEQQMERGERQAAVETWRRILRTNDSRAEAHVTLAELLADHDMPEQAASEFREALKLEADHLQATRGLAESLERLRRENEATALWLRVIELAHDDRPLRREARRRLIAIWGRSGQLHERLNQYARKFSINGSDAQANDTEAGRFLAQGYERLAADRGAQAAHYRQLTEQVLQRIITLEPADVEALTSLEHVLATRGDLDGAIAILERLLLADPPRARSYLARMASYALQLYRDDQAIEYAERSVTLNADDAEAHQRLGDLYRARQNVDRAIAAYERAVKLNDRLFDAYFVLAELHLSRGQNADADRYLRRVMRACPDDELVARATRASLQIHLGDGTIDVLENELLPLALGHPQRPIFRRLVIELYDASTQTTQGATDETRNALAKRAIKPLLEALADPSPDQQRVAVRILSELNHPGAAVPLLTLAESDAEMDLRRAALLAAGNMAEDAMAPRFAALATGPHRRLRDAAAWALASMNTAAAWNELGRLLDNSLPVVRAYAATGLGASGQTRWIPQLAAMVRTDRSPAARSAAALALAAMRAPESVATLTAILRGQDEQAAPSTVIALGVMGQASAAPVLCDALFAADRELQRAAAWALAQLERAQRFEPRQLVQRPNAQGEITLWSPDFSTLTEATLELVAQRFPAALEQAMRNALGGAKETSLATLQQLGDAIANSHTATNTKSALATLVTNIAQDVDKAARHPDRDIRIAALGLLALVESPTSAPAFERALRDTDPSVRSAALVALSQRDATQGSQSLTQLLQLAREAPQWAMRLRALEAIHKQGGDAACPALVHALKHDDYAYVRERSVHWVDRRCGSEGAQALRWVADHDAEPRVRAAATTAIGAN